MVSPFLIALSLALAAAAPTTAPPTRLSELLREAHAHNPDLEAAAWRAKAARAAISPAGALENPMLMAQLWNAPADFSSLPVMLQISQSLPLGGKLGLRRAAAEAEYRAAQAEAQTRSFDVDEAVKTAYFELFQAERQQKVDAEIATTLDALRASALARIEAGTGRQVDAIQAQAGALQAASDGDVAEQQAIASRARLTALLDRPPDEPFGPTTTPELLAALPPLPELEKRAMQARPELAEAAAAIDAAEAQAHLARAEKVPDLGLMLAGMHTFGGQGQSNFIFAGAQIDLPIFFGSKNEPRVEAADARAEAERAALRGQRNRIAAEIARARALLEADARQIATHHQLIPLDRQALQSAEHSYIAGSLEFLTVLASVRDLQMHELALAGQLAAYEKHLAELERAVGADLGLVAASEAGSAHEDL